MMSNLYNEPFKGSFYDVDYFENGPESGKGWLRNYSWMPQRNYREAFAYIDYLELDEKSHVLDVGCAKGFIVKALRNLEIKADGCDISEYALTFAPEGCWDCSTNEAWEEHYGFGYTNIIAKDVFEHLTKEQLSSMLKILKNVAPKIMCIVPIGDSGVYRIPEYHTEISHLIIEDEDWWLNKFDENGWSVEKHCPHVKGLKDNWLSHANGLGNHVFVLNLNNYDNS